MDVSRCCRAWLALSLLAVPCPLALARPFDPKDGMNPAELIDRLSSPEAEMRAAAASGLGTAGWAKAAVPELTALLDDPDLRVEAQAALALLSIGPGPAPPGLSPRLVRMLAAPDAEVRTAAARVAAWAGDPDESLIRALLDCLPVPKGPGALPAQAPYDRDPSAHAACALIRLGRPEPGVRALRSMLVDPDSDVRELALGAIAELGEPAGPLAADVARLLDDEGLGGAAASALGHLGPGVGLAEKELVGRRLAEALAARADHTRYEASLAFRDLGRYAAPAVPVLISLLDDPSPETRKSAAEALRWIGPPAAPAVEPLIRLVRRESPMRGQGPAEPSEDWSFRTAPVEALGAIGSAAAEAAPVLAYRLRRDPEPEVRARTAEALGSIGPPAASAIPALVDRIRHDPDGRVHGAALTSLRQIGPASLPRLMALTLDSRPGTRRAALYAMGEMGDTGALPAIARALLAEPDSEVRWFAARALTDFGKRAAPVAPALLAAIAREYDPLPPDYRGGWGSPGAHYHTPDEARAEAIRALVLTGERPREATAPLISALRRGEPELRRWAAWGLASIGEPAEVVPALVDCLHGDADYSTKEEAVDSLVKRSTQRMAARALRDELRGAEPWVRHRAADGLGERDSLPPILVAAMRDYLTDDSAYIRLAAVKAVTKAGRDRRALSIARELVNSTEASTAKSAAKVLLEFGEPAGTVLPCLSALVREGDREALFRLADMGPSARPAVPAVLDYLRRGVLWWEKEDAVKTLSKINGPATDVDRPAR